MVNDLRRLDPATPVLVGVGVAHHVPPATEAQVDLPGPLDLMEWATRSAVADLGLSPGATPSSDDAQGSGDLTRSAAFKRRIGMVAVPEGNWVYRDPGAEVARRVGVFGARTVRVDIGVPQHTPVAAALRLITAGDLDAALIVGGEARASQVLMKRAGLAPLGTADADSDVAATDPDDRWRPSGEIMAQGEIDAGMWSAVEHYACIGAALRNAEGLDVAAGQDEVARLWLGFNEVATRNPQAAFGEARSLEFLRAAGPGNRPLAFPYAKWHSTQWSVDQAAALILCSVAVAREFAIPTERWVFPRVALESSHSLSLTRRAYMHRWQAMGTLGDAAEKHLGRGLGELDHHDLYSCFPSAVQVQQRELGLDPTKTPTITGGMAFAGGPFNNFSYQATAAMADRLRMDPGTAGLVTTVSGLLTKPALAVWSTTPGPFMVDDLGARAAIGTPTREVVEPGPSPMQGRGTIASYTATYDDYRIESMFVIVDMVDGRRWIGRSTDPSLLATVETTELIGTEVSVDGTTCRT